MRKTLNSGQITKIVMLALLFIPLSGGLFIIFKGSLIKDTAQPFVWQERVYGWGMACLTALLGLVWLYVRLQDPEMQPRKRPGRWFYPVISGLLAFWCMSMAYTYLGVWPLGDRSVMTVDMHHQYAPMLDKLREMLLQGGSPFYSFEIGAGTSFLPLFAYYLASPFNLLLILFPEHLLTEGILVITLLKNALCAAFFAACLQYVYRRRGPAIPALAVMYSMMMYMLAYSWNIMWLDGVMMLPLVILFFEKMMRTGRIAGYALSLAYTLFVNYYIGFMICIFLVLYYIAFALRKRRPAEGQARGFARFLGGSLLGGGMAMFLLIPVALALGRTSAAGAEMPDFSANFDMFSLLGRHLYGTTPTIRSGNLPNLYCGLLAVVLLPIFATLKAIPRRRRITYMALWAAMGISLVINVFDLLWHGNHAPNDLPYRFSFLYCFVLLLIAYEVLIRPRQIRLKQITGSFVGIVAYLMLEERFGEDVYGFSSIYISLLLAAVYALLLFLGSRRRHMARPATCLILLAVVLEMTLGGGATLRTLNANEYFTPHTDYVDNDVTRAIQKAVDRAEEIGDAEMEGAFYRMEFAPRRTFVDTALFGYRGITLFSSSNYYTTTKFLGNVGYEINGVNSHTFRNFVPALDSLMGLRYVVLQNNGGTDTAAGLGLEKLDTVSEGGYTYDIYRNPDALPPAFAVQSSVGNWRSAWYNPFEAQNSLYTLMTGNGAPLYVYQQVTVEPESVSIASVNEGDSSAIYINPNGTSSTARFNVTLEQGGRTFVYLDCTAAQSMSVTCNGVSTSVSPRQAYIVSAGNLPAGATLTASITTDSPCSGNVYVVTLDEAVYRQNMQILSANGLQVTRFTDSSLEGSLTAAKAGTVFTSIPYDAGWSVKVDGKAVETYAVCDGALLAFDIDAGAHTVEMRFLPRGLVPGIVISLLCLAILIIVSVVLPRRRAKRPPVPGDGERSPAEKAPEGPGGTASSAGEADAARSAASSQPEVPLYQPGLSAAPPVTPPAESSTEPPAETGESTPSQPPDAP